MTVLSTRAWRKSCLVHSSTVGMPRFNRATPCSLSGPRRCTRCSMSSRITRTSTRPAQLFPRPTGNRESLFLSLSEGEWSNMTTQTEHAMTGIQRFRVLVIGSGFSGVGLAIRLKEQGEDSFIVLEREHDLGGSWRDN